MYTERVGEGERGGWEGANSQETERDNVDRDTRKEQRNSNERVQKDAW